MSTLRTRLEAGAHPGTDPRRTAQLLAQLRRLADQLSPRWRPTGERDDVGSALLGIGARLAEETTRRLDATARRDALAFFDLLGLPPSPPRAATGVVALALEGSLTRPVHAPARTQVAVAPEDGDEVTFETRDTLRVVPGRIAEVVTVDPATDRIELAPAPVTSLEPPAPRPADFRVVSFAGPGSRTLQVTPSTGLLAGEDVLRIGGSAHRVAEVDDAGLITLLDPLRAPAPPGTTATRITALESSTLPDQQRHVVYLGHEEVLNLEQPATVDLDLTPASLARRLGGLDVRYTAYGTPEGQEAPDWHPLDVLGTSASGIRLAKAWTGPVETTEVQGRPSRWLRAELRGPVADVGTSTRASGVQLTVASVTGDGAGRGAPGEARTATGTPEGSTTVAQAAHNGAPLATTRRFFPFGPEPLRFDTFALAAPEALSKKGARVTLDVTMVDSSLVGLGVVVGADAGPARVYGVARNGYLQALVLEPDGGVRWLETDVVAPDAGRVLLGAAPPGAVASTGRRDLVVVTDRHGDLWSAVVTISEAPSVLTAGTWHRLPRPGGTGEGARRDGPSSTGGTPAPVVAPTPSGGGTTALVVDVHEGALHVQRLDAEGRPRGAWVPVTQPDPGPTLSTAAQVTVVQGAHWPARPDRVELLALDDDGAPWLAAVDAAATTDTVTASWRAVPGPAGADLPAARADVAPVATRFLPDGDGTGEHLWIGYAAAPAAGRPAGLVGVDLVDDVVTVHELGADVSAGTALHANPALPGVGGLPTTVGLTDERRRVTVWQGEQRARTSTLPVPASSPRPLLLRTDPGPDPGQGRTGAADLVVAGDGERLLRGAVTPAELVRYSLHDLVRHEAVWAPDLVEITTDPGDPATSTLVEVGRRNRRIVRGRVRIYDVGAGRLTAGAQLRFLRLTEEGYTGTMDPPASRTVLRLDDADTEATKRDVRLVVGGATVRVVDVTTDRVATLDRPVPEESVEAGTGRVAYRVSDAEASGVVTEADLGTLVRLKTAGAPQELVFGPPASPRTQRVLLGDREDGWVWVRLAEAWRAAPDAGTPAGTTERVVWTERARTRGYRNPDLSWEYYDGAGWRRLQRDFVDGTDNLSTTGSIRFTVPADLATTEIGGTEDLWIRARLVGGDYGRPTYVVHRESVADGATEQQVVVDTSGLRPPEILAIEASFATPGPVAPQIVLVENNLDVVDATQAASVASAGFDLFRGAEAIDVRERALFAGLTTPFGRGALVLFVDAVDQPGIGTLRVDLRTPEGWARVPVDDGTASLRRTGTVTLSLDRDPVATRLFGRDRVWLRFRCGDLPAAGAGGRLAAGGGSGGDWAPVVRALLPNAVAISQARTLGDEILGSGLGQPGTSVALANLPVLPDSVELRVREDLGDEERAALEAESAASARPGGPERPAVVVSGLDRVPGTWVLWRRVDSLLGEDGDARVYVLDPATGKVTFGDGRRGKIPPAGRDGIRCFRYQQGGGAVGNVPAWSRARLTTAVEGVETAVLPRAAAGGADAPPPDSVFATAPQRLRHVGRAMTPADVEALAVASLHEVVRARCRRPARAGDPVRVTIAVRDDAERCPRPTQEQLAAVARSIRATGWGALAEESVRVDGPRYVPLTVRADLVAAPDLWAEVERASTSVLVDLFDPVRGGPERSGWPFGRRPTPADVLRALSSVPGLDRVAAVGLAALPGGSLDDLPLDALVCADARDITVTVTAGGDRS